MRGSWGAGEVVVILLSAISYLFGFTSPAYTLSLLFLLSGVWTIAAGLFLVEKRDRTFYSSWGVVVAVLSAFAFLPINYALGLVLVAVVVLILLTVFNYRSGKMLTAVVQPAPATTGETPAAS